MNFSRIAKLATGLCACVLAQTATAQDYHPTFDPSALKGPPAGKLNEVMVLGSPHLSQLPKGSVTQEALQPILARLERWYPEAIAVEALSGLQCEAMRGNLGRYAETVETYCPDPSVAGRALGLGVVAANAEAERVLANWSDTPSPAERRHLAALFLAAGEPDSALVQWLYLPEQERVAADGLTDELAAALVRRSVRSNENSQIAAVLAVRLGLERVWSVDDHTADTPSGDEAETKAYGDAITKAWGGEPGRERGEREEALKAGLAKPDGLLAIYRAYNEPEFAQLAYRSDFGAAFVEPSPQAFGRQYLAYWETRNLRMVSNIRGVLGQKPGMRLLAIVGASHKGYYEAYLDQMHDVKLTDTSAVLR